MNGDGGETHTDTRRVLDAFRQIVRVLRLSAAEAEKQAGLSGAQLFVLQKLGGDTVSVNELARRTHTDQSSVSVVVRRLCDKGFARRCRSTTDARRTEVTITPAGAKKLRGAPSTAQDSLINALRQMTRRDQKHLARLLEQLAAGAGAAKTTPVLFFEEEHQKEKRKRNG